MSVTAERCHLNRLVCFLQDLQTLYVYWDFSPERIRTLTGFVDRIIPGATIQLRLCRFGSEEPDGIAGLTSFETGNYYFRNVTPDKSYHFEIGAANQENRFILFARTPVLEIQPNGSLSPGFGIGPITLPVVVESGDRQIPLDNFSWS